MLLPQFKCDNKMHESVSGRGIELTTFTFSCNR